jgi:hypothetical protein
MNKSNLSRRALLSRGLPFVAGGVLLPILVRAADGPACHDPAASDQGLRQSLNYTETGEDATKICGGCGFFSAGEPAGCGDCQIFHGPANVKGHCDSWSPKG